MNDHEIDRIAAAANALRPDWPLGSIRTLLTKKLAHRPRRDVAVALAWIACEPNTATPARVLEDGPWWRAAAVEGNATSRKPPRPDDECRLHVGEYAHNCRSCQADRLAGDDTTPRTTQRVPMPAHVRHAAHAAGIKTNAKENHA